MTTSCFSVLLNSFIKFHELLSLHLDPIVMSPIKLAHQRKSNTFVREATHNDGKLGIMQLFVEFLGG